MKKLLTLILINLLVIPGYAVINPSKQPAHLANNFKSVLIATVKKVDSTNLQIDLAIDQVTKGKFPVKNVTMVAKDKSLLEEMLSVAKGQKIVAFAGKKRPKSKRNQVLYYVGGGKWFMAEMDKKDKSKWTLLHNADKGVESTSKNIMFATFNGRVESLAEMMQDAAADKAYFPARPFTKFSVDSIWKTPAPPRGVALYDVNQDGKLDIFATSANGCRLFVQSEKMKFADKSKEWGIAGVSGISCDFADVDADGKSDMLVDGTVFIQDGGKFVKKHELGKDLLSASFADMNKDGFPDVITSQKQSGLKVFLNEKGKNFADKTTEFGLDADELKKTGYFEVIDWDADGNLDIIYTGGTGQILYSSGPGKPVESGGDLGEEGEEYELGAAAAGNITTPGTPAVYLTLGENKMLFQSNEGDVESILRYGNEIQDPASGLFMCVAEDLNADGTIDLYASTKSDGDPAFFVTNRGYGSFMMDTKYNPKHPFPLDVYNKGAWGIAVGDVNADGANDMLVATLDGKLVLLLNEVLKSLPMKADQAARQDDRRRIETRIVTVRLKGKTGVKGAVIKLLDDKNKLVASRLIGSNKGVGCSGPDQVAIAVRNFGKYKIEVTFSDGKKQEKELSLTSSTPRNQFLDFNR